MTYQCPTPVRGKWREKIANIAMGKCGKFLLMNGLLNWLHVFKEMDARQSLLHNSCNKEIFKSHFCGIVFNTPSSPHIMADNEAPSCQILFKIRR